MIFVTCFMHVCLTIKYYKIMGGDKIVLLDGAGANGGGIYDHYGMHEKMKEMEERENELEERERRLEERERRHEMEDREYRRMGYESYPIDYYGDDRYYGDGPQMRRGRGRGRGRSY